MSDASSKSDDLKGRAKEAVGDLTDNADLKREGKTDRAAGKVKEKLSDAKDKLEDVVDNVKDKLAPRLGQLLRHGEMLSEPGDAQQSCHRVGGRLEHQCAATVGFQLVLELDQRAQPRRIDERGLRQVEREVQDSRRTADRRPALPTTGPSGHRAHPRLRREPRSLHASS